MLQGLIMADIANDVGYSMRREIAEKIDRVPISYFDQRSYGDVLSRVTNDVDLVTQGVSESVSQLTISAATIAGVFVMMLTIDPVMTLAAVLILPAAFGIMRIFSRHSQKYFRQYTTISQNHADVVLATLGNDAGIYGAVRMVLADGKE